jgi:hypothetical protein
MADAWALITPEGDLAWYSLDATGEVQDLVSSVITPGTLGLEFVTGPIRAMACDSALLPNPVARVAITALSEARITQPFRGHVALVQYGQDGRTGNWLGPAEMEDMWRGRITKAVMLARGGWGD